MVDPTRRHELENLRRSIVMLSPGQPALRREEALGLIGELQSADHELEALRTGLRSLLRE